MFEQWQLQDFAPGAGEAAGAAAAQAGTTGWIPVAVPGDVHAALIAAGRIPDPFYDRNEDACRWVEDREWWYRTTFPGPDPPLASDERLQLVFEGLDTFATIWLNGQELGRSANMFRAAVFDVTGQVQPGVANSLAVRFAPPLTSVDDVPAPPNPLPIGDARRVCMRKAQYAYGWDWGPRLPGLGIWRPVRLLRQRRAAIAGVHVTTRALTPAHDRADVHVAVEVDRFAAAGPLTVAVTLPWPGDAAPAAGGEIVLPDGQAAAAIALAVPAPRLWWTADLGEPALYTLRVELRQDGVLLASQEQAAGIRTLTLDQAPDPEEPGTRFFRFVLNGVPIFARGANWIPADLFAGRVPAARYTALLEQARDAHMNMLRVWGGGLYEPDVFYDTCDRLGILVWQDFMFACAAYPERPESFVANVTAEVAYQIRRLRNHPALALWCGNNENQVTFELLASLPRPAGAEAPAAPALEGTLYYEQIMPRLVAALDGATPYWPGSPYSGPGVPANSQRVGDVHDWTVWHGFDDTTDVLTLFTQGPRPEQVAFTRYAEDQGRFISEFGIHASPVFETLRRSVPADQLYHHSPALDAHNKDQPKNKVDLLMVTTTGLPRDLAEFVDFSMMTQAEGLQFGIAHFRRRTPHCSGALIWQLNDCWPGQSWSLIDYYGFPKAGYYAVRRAYAPVLASFQALPDGAVAVWLTNDTRAPVTDTLLLEYGDFATGAHWREAWPIAAAPGSNAPVGRLAAGRIPPGPDRYLALRAAGDSFPGTRHFFVPLKDLQRTPAPPTVTLTPDGAHALRVTIQAPGYLRYVHVLAPDAATRFSDNYFDLLPGEFAHDPGHAPHRGAGAGGDHGGVAVGRGGLPISIMQELSKPTARRGGPAA